MDGKEAPGAGLLSAAFNSANAPPLLQVRAMAQNRHPANVREMTARTPAMCGFLLVQSQSLLSLRPESSESFRKDISILRKERRGRILEGTIFGNSLEARETS